GHIEEVEHYAQFIENIAISEDRRYQPLYAIGGEARIEEKIVDLKGDLGNWPVRFGNQAYTHVQNDVYGQILVFFLGLNIDPRLRDAARSRWVSSELVMRVLAGIEQTMNEADAGLWEFRNRTQMHCYTFLFHWAGSKAALKIAHATSNTEMKVLAT